MGSYLAGSRIVRRPGQLEQSELERLGGDKGREVTRARSCKDLGSGSHRRVRSNKVTTS